MPNKKKSHVEQLPLVPDTAKQGIKTAVHLAKKGEMAMAAKSAGIAFRAQADRASVKAQAAADKAIKKAVKAYKNKK